ncbi:hypothetical protein PMAYCL1PPCAC_01685, partial [Pristionchus mayeri]
ATVAADRFQDEKVVPDVFANSPQQTMTVTYIDETNVQEGNQLTPTQVKHTPTVEWKPDGDALYTLIMTDPDSLTPVRQYLHWLVINIHGSDVSTGVQVAAYQGAGPPPGTGAHRYVFSVWKQNRTLVTDDHGKTTSQMSMLGRLRFNTTEYASRVSGDTNPTPVAANFFKASFDDYVKYLQGQFEK